MHPKPKRNTTQHNATENENQMTLAQLRALGPLASGEAISQVAEAAGVNRSTIYRWFRDDAVFVAEFNRLKEEKIHSVQMQLREMAKIAVDVLRELLENKDAPPSVRLRTALAILGSVGGIQKPEVGETDPADIELAWTIKHAEQFHQQKKTLDY